MGNAIQQERATVALEQVLRVIEEGPGDQKEYKAYASELPAMIHMNGLGQAAAFYYSKKGTRLLLYELLDDWLRRDGQPYAGRDALLDGICAGNQRSYHLAQAEALAMMEWVKKFAKAFMESD
jgi:CRISPR-associated protein Cmr5